MWYVFNMKNILLIIVALLLAGCSTQQSPSGIGQVMYDMNAVQAYKARLASGDTVTEKQKMQVLAQESNPITLNASDRKATTKNTIPANISIVPAIGVGYYHGFGHRYW